MSSARVTIERFRGAVPFLDAAAPWLLREEARHNLLLGVSHSAATHRDMYPTFRGWIVRDRGDIAGAAMQTPPFSAIVGTPRNDVALDALVDALVADVPDLGGITGAVPEVGATVDAWTARTGAAAEVRVGMGVYELRAVATVPHPPGGARPAIRADRDLLLEWHRVFADDVGEGGSPQMRDPERIATAVDTRLVGGDEAGFWLWERDREPVAMAGYSGPTGTGIRVGPVFTPSTQRGNGYATALVADLSAWLLEGGRRACFLYTDLANPTSNAIYERIGYRKVCDALDVTLTPAGVR